MAAAATRATSDLVPHSRIDTEFVNADRTRHLFVSSDRRAGRRRLKVEETWHRRRELGNGTFGRVWLEGCVDGPRKGQLRAVKEILKFGDCAATIDYNTELEAIAKFSHSRVGRLGSIAFLLWDAANCLAS